MTRPVALVTGAAKRIGKSTATHLHKNGYNVIVHCHNSETLGQQFVEQLNTERPNSAALIVADLLDVENFDVLAKDALALFGRINLLINNASTFYPTTVSKVNFAEWNDLMTTNLKAPFFLIQAFEEQLNTNKGCVINMVDIHAERPLLGYSVYCIAKAGLAMLTKSLSRELAPNIRVNGIAPGAILWHENELEDQDKVDVLNEIALNRLGCPEDIAEAILYLANANYVTGQILAVDGGRSVNGGAKA